MSYSIDTIINQVLTTFKNRLWTGKNNAFYGRTFRTEERDGYTSKIYPLISLPNNQHIEVLKDNAKDAICFFDVQPTSELFGTLYKHRIWVMFMVDLEKIYPTLTRNEATEKAKNDAIRILKIRFDEVTNVVSGYPAFAEYNWQEAGRADVSPHYLFRVECIMYNTNC